ncbi:hypothetical protein KKC74_07990, partial [bacterium]|nr:hypothetical protein [bacterium]
MGKEENDLLKEVWKGGGDINENLLFNFDNQRLRRKKMNLLINLKKNPLSFFFLVVILSVGILYAQEQVGGPYTVDANTMLLMHFEDNLDNVSTLSANGEVHGNLTYGNNTVTVLGKCLQLDNDAAEDLSYVTVADTAALDLTGDWTIEGWFNMVSNDAAWNVTPRLA